MLPVNPNREPSDKQVFHHVPEHWTIRRIRTIAEMRVSNVDKHTNEQEIPVRLCNYVDVYYHDHINSDLPYMHATASYAEVQRFRLKPNDVLITKDSETWNDIAVPALVTDPPNDLICGYHLAILRPTRAIEGAYLARALQTRPVAQQFHVKAQGITRYGLSHDDILSTNVPLPPLEEQAAIVRYLDHADELINRYISAKERLIALLEEQRQAAIHQAVTRGLDPNAPSKQSSVEWLADVPQHWQLPEIKQVSKILRGKFTHRPRNDPSLYGGIYPFIQTGDVAAANGIIRTHRQTLNQRGLAVSTMFPAGTLVMTIAANIGDVAVLNFEACFPDSIVGFVPTNKVERDFLYYLFRAMKSEFLREAPVNTQGNLNVERIGSRKIPLPSVDEQVTIVRHLAEVSAHIDASMELAHRQVSLIGEYRTRLIADVVTGQIDVHSAEIGLTTDNPLSETLPDNLTGKATDRTSPSRGNS